jgi:subtilisin family serine protease
MRLIPFILGLIFVINPLFSQEKYWIYFTDKGQSNSIDASVSPHYVSEIESRGIRVLNHSKWLNAVSVKLSKNQLSAVNNLKFVKEIEPVQAYEFQAIRDTDPDFHYVLEQINARAFVDAGLTANEVKIGIIDGGFQGAGNNPYFEKIFEENRVIKAKDFVTDRDPLSSPEESSKDWHGTAVWKFIAGNDGNKMAGLAVNAHFYLARTEHGDMEYRGEEDNWIAAIEWLEENGVRLVNSSLGYSIGFNDPKENYSPEQMDGKTTAISKAAQIAVEKKKMILVASAGNDGNNSKWKIITTPADAKGVISVGSTYKEPWPKAGYSAIGADFVNYIKPNIACYSMNGTSFSAPVITGVIGCMLEMDPSLSGKSIKSLLQLSGHLYPFPNNYLGYGVPDCKKILDEMSGENFQPTSSLVRSKLNFFMIECKDPDDKVVVYHKSDRYIVSKERLLTPENGRIVVHRPKDIDFTTVRHGDEVFEIQWKK